MNISEDKFGEFSVYRCDECNCFMHINIDEPDRFYSKMFEYFFDEGRLLSYIENKSCLPFTPSSSNYATLYKKLQIFLDKENIIDIPNSIQTDILNIICQEHTIIETNGIKKIRLDKVGKIGEYIFSVLLSDFFKFECIIPKLNLLTDYNMSIFGIDTLFYSPTNKLILLGESKVSTSLDNGITLINKSLSTYKTQVDDEFNLILSQRWLKDKMGSFQTDFGNQTEISLSMSDFITKADIKNIGIPIFIAHGGYYSVEDIFKKLKVINKISLYGLNTIYVSVSLPIIDKKRFLDVFTFEIAKRRCLYAQNV